MVTPDELLYQIELSDYTLQKQLAGITPDEALLQLPFRGNSLNWILGHIVEARHYMLDLLGVPRVWSAAQCQRYTTGSAPVTGSAPPPETWADLLAAADESLKRIQAKLQTMTAEDLQRIPPGDTDPLGKILLRMTWHEAYHVGQTELLRQLAGKNDAVL
jgi:uncharacterized damage-inducible protein DinB